MKCTVFGLGAEKRDVTMRTVTVLLGLNESFGVTEERCTEISIN